MLYCMERFKPLRKSSFSGYTVDTFKFKLKDVMKKIIRRRKPGQIIDDVIYFYERNGIF